MRKVYKQITYTDRLRIEQMYLSGIKIKDMANEIGICYQTMYKELKRGKSEEGLYSADRAQKSLFLKNSV